MATLPTIACPSCNRPIVSAEFTPNKKGAAPTATSYESCLRRCGECGIGFSNSKKDPTRIYRDPLDNVPEEAQEGAVAVLDRAFNERNRLNKKSRFGFRTSEDAVTWTVFNYLRTRTRLGDIPRLVSDGKLARTTRNPSCYLWAVNLERPESSPDELQKSLIGICDALKEHKRSRSEPDVILLFGRRALVFVEVKYLRGGNMPRRTADEKYGRYVDCTAGFRDPAMATRSKCYELVRNWRIGSELQECLGAEHFVLVNLIPERLRRSRVDTAAVHRFADSLNQERRSFLQLTWTELLTAIPKPWEPWFAAYVQARNLLGV